MEIKRIPNGDGTLLVEARIPGETVYKYDYFVDTITDEALERALIRCTDNDRIRRQMKAGRKEFLAGQNEEAE